MAAVAANFGTQKLFFLNLCSRGASGRLQPVWEHMRHDSECGIQTVQTAGPGAGATCFWLLEQGHGLRELLPALNRRAVNGMCAG
jgi:hypothetical protein